MLIYIGWTRQWLLLKDMKIPQGILLAFAVGLPWYVLMYKVHGEVFLDTFIGYHNLTRFAAPEHPGQNSLVFFIPVLLAAMMPWTVYLGRPFGGCLKRGILFATRSGSVSYGPGSSFSFSPFQRRSSSPISPPCFRQRRISSAGTGTDLILNAVFPARSWPPPMFWASYCSPATPFP